MTRRTLSAAALAILVALSAAACPANRVHHGEVRCYAQDGTEIPCDFGPRETP